MFLQILRSADLKNFVRNDRTFSQLLTFLHEIAFEDNDVFADRNQMFFFAPVCWILDDDAALAANVRGRNRRRRRSWKSQLRLSDGALRTIPPRAADRP